MDHPAGAVRTRLSGIEYPHGRNLAFNAACNSDPHRRLKSDPPARFWLLDGRGSGGPHIQFRIGINLRRNRRGRRDILPEGGNIAAGHWTMDILRTRADLTVKNGGITF